MRLTFVINDIASEQSDYLTIHLARRAMSMGHDIALVSLANMTYEADESVTARAYLPSKDNYEDTQSLVEDLQESAAAEHTRTLSQDDVILLRADPADELTTRPWAHTASLLFAQLASEQGVIVLNDPYKLTDASNKTYFQQFPAKIRPRTCISRDVDIIKAFIEAEGGKAVIKPLQGSGGHGVFIIKDGEGANINQMIEATVRDGYAIVQEYLPLAAEGDLRLFTMNGLPLEVDGTYACFRRYNDSEDARSNISAGGKVELAEPTDEVLALVELVGPKIHRDGMYLAGLDIVGDKMMEINVDSPGGLPYLEQLTGKDFCGAIIRDLERKVRLQEHYGRRLGHAEIASL